MDKADTTTDEVKCKTNLLRSLENTSACEKKCDGIEPPTRRKGTRPVPNSLLKGTKSSTARSILQKCSNDRSAKGNSRNNSQRGNTPVSKEFTPQLNSVLKAKKVAVSSFILPPEEKQEVEDLMPDKANWDASAIEPLKKLELNTIEKENTPGCIDGRRVKEVKYNRMVKEVPKMTTIGTAKKALASVRKPAFTKNKEPIKASILPSTSVITGTKTPINNSEKSEALQSLQEIENLYDDYLVSELMLMNAKRNCDMTCDQINNEVLEMWSAMEMLRGEVLKLKEKNENNKKMLTFYEAATFESPNIENNIKKKLPDLCEQMKQLAEALEQSRHHLKILGARVDRNDDTENTLLRILGETLSTLCLENKSNNNLDLLKKNATQISELNIDLENSISAFDRCKVLLKSLKSATLHATSLFLSTASHQDETQEYNKEEFNLCNIKCTMDEFDSSDQPANL